MNDQHVHVWRFNRDHWDTPVYHQKNRIGGFAPEFLLVPCRKPETPRDDCRLLRRSIWKPGWQRRTKNISYLMKVTLPDHSIHF